MTRGEPRQPRAGKQHYNKASGHSLRTRLPPPPHRTLPATLQSSISALCALFIYLFLFKTDEGVACDGAGISQFPPLIKLVLGHRSGHQSTPPTPAHIVAWKWSVSSDWESHKRSCIFIGSQDILRDYPQNGRIKYPIHIGSVIVHINVTFGPCSALSATNAATIYPHRNCIKHPHLPVISSHFLYRLKCSLCIVQLLTMDAVCLTLSSTLSNPAPPPLTWPTPNPHYSMIHSPAHCKPYLLLAKPVPSWSAMLGQLQPCCLINKDDALPGAPSASFFFFFYLQ